MTKEITKKLPSIQDLYSNKLEVTKRNELNIILNVEPKKEWVKQHPFVKNLKYLPIETVEYLLTMIFTKWRVEVKEIKLLANSVVTTVRVWVLDPITNEWDYQDGIGAMPIQVQKGSGATEFDKMNSSAIQMGAPASESFAIKDACEKFGRIFGKDLNRKDTQSYDRLYTMIEGSETYGNPTLTDEVRKEVTDTTNATDLSAVYEKHKGLGKEFDKLVAEHSEFISQVEKDDTAS